MSVTPFLHGKGAANSGTGVTTCSPPGSEAQPPSRFLICAVHTQNQALPSIADNAGNSAAWTLIPGAEVNNGVAGGTAGAVRAYLYYKWGSGNTLAQDQVVLGDSGDHQYGHIFGFDNVDRIDPFSAVATSTQAATTSAVMPGVTTDENNSLVCYFTFLTRDASSTANLSGQANANLTNVTEQHDQSTSTALGGGICLTTGVLATAGASGNLTATAVNQAMAHVSVGLNPDDSRAIIEQLEAEVWTQPEGGAVIEHLEAETWFEIENSGRVYNLEAELWYIPSNAVPTRRRLALM